MKARGSKECKNCHDFDAMDPEEQDRKARKRHAAAKEKGMHCMECHSGVAHEEPDEPEEEES
jgi:cytochrome c-type protein NapC